MKRIILFEQTEYRFIIYFRDKKKIVWRTNEHLSIRTEICKELIYIFKKAVEEDIQSSFIWFLFDTKFP